MDVIKVEPLTTARALRGPFDYRRPEGVDVGSIL
jgi:primosomal protein N' (replication factor Y) (superfamily II helicase)